MPKNMPDLTLADDEVIALDHYLTAHGANAQLEDLQTRVHQAAKMILAERKAEEKPGSV